MNVLTYMFILICFSNYNNLLQKNMNKDKGCYSFKENYQTNPRRSSRNGMRIDTLPNHQMTSNAYPSPPVPKKKGTTLMYKGQNSQSTYLKRVKIGSFRARNETECEQKKKQNRDPWAPDPASVLGKMKKDDKQEVESKNKSMKSFMIRKKNISSYSKQQFQELTNIQNMHKMIMQEVFDHSKELNRKVFGDHQSFNLEGDHYNKTKPKSLYALQNSSDQTEKKSLKLKVIFCKDHSNISRGPNQVLQSRAQPSIEKKANDSNKLILVQNEEKQLSKQSLKESKQTNCRKESKTKSLHIKEEKDNKHKCKTYVGCKTIRVPWELSGGSFHHTTKGDKQLREKIIKLDSTMIKEQLNFGQISMIPLEEAPQRKTQKKNSMVIESLQQLYQELEKGYEKTQKKDEDQFLL